MASEPEHYTIKDMALFGLIMTVTILIAGAIVAVIYWIVVWAIQTLPPLWDSYMAWYNGQGPLVQYIVVVATIAVGLAIASVISMALNNPPDPRKKKGEE